MTYTSTSQDSSSRFASRVLAFVVLLQALGLALTAAREGTSIGTWLFVERGWSEALSITLERAGTLAAMLGCLLAVFARGPAVRLAGAVGASAWCLALALFESKVGGAPYTEVALPAHAIRVAAPLLLALLHRRGAAVSVLRVSIALTFAIHGFEALGLHPGFIDYLLAADQRLFGLGLEQGEAEILLRLIGIHDVVLAVLVLSGRETRHVLGWMALWGAVTALSRVVQGGGGAAHHALIRVANAGLPLVLLFLSPRTLMNTPSLRMGGRLARAALPLLLVLLLPFAANAQALSGANPGHLRIIWTEDPAHRATISWSTASAGSTHEVYLDTQSRSGVLSAYARKVAAKNASVGSAATHHAVVTDLKPATTYYFVVVSDGKASPERHFITAPDDDRAFRLLSGGDSRSGLAERKKMNQLMAKLLEQDPGIIAFVHGGDYNASEDSWSEWDGWLTDHALTFTAAGRVLPIIPTLGNHEGGGAMFDAVFNTPGSSAGTYYTVKLGANVSLITLDTNSSIGGTQAKWLEQQLQAAQTGRWIVPNYHKPAFPAVKTPSGARQFWVPLFEKYNVDLVLESDGHVLKRTLPIRGEKHDATGVVYVGEGGLGVPQRTPSSQWYLKAPGMAKSAHHVQVLSFSPTKLVYEARGMAGGTEDTYTFQPRRTGTVVTPPVDTPLPAAPAIASVAARSDTQVAVTFSADMDRATSGVPGAYRIVPAQASAPDVQVRDVAVESARTYVLSTNRLTAGADYSVSVTGARTAEGGTAAQPVTAAFKVPEAGTPVEPAPEDPVPPAPEAPVDPVTPAPEEQPQLPPSQAIEDAQPQAASCSAAAGGSLMWAGVMVAALAARRRRRSR